MLDIDRLRALNAISEYGSVSAAADVLGITTSAVSQQIAKLERETSARLLERSGRGVRLTDAAQLLVRHSERILAMIAEAEADLEAQLGSVAGRLSIAAFATAARSVLPPALRDLALRYPNLNVQMFEADPGVSQTLVQRGDYDLALVQDWVNSPLPVLEGTERLHLFDDPAEIVLPADHPLADRDELAAGELVDEDWIVAPQGTICFEWLCDTLRRAGVEPRVAHYATEYPTQIALVAAGLGLAVLPRLGRGLLPPGVRTVPLRPVLVRSVYVLLRREAGRRPAVRAAVAALRSTVDKLDDGTRSLDATSAPV
ncbi:LysR family transcriptional regulator [Streptomonospora sp. S1-112]|uniref:LysR family transcriptional regulator n=1 Tax=Streptomonospora mangrovi TaxID=2883123 RepID=A0A9X3SLU2_9ACTN|nr:LysR family transcriptional regulator [Streptomonospora mangrovi]MDA0563711.1 LysR family transcriptional regulator [Streptomonospora mangrovi]